MVGNGTLKTYPGLSHGMATTHPDLIGADLLAFPQELGPLDARVEGEFDPNTAWLAHDEMDLRPLARELGGEFDNNARPTGDVLIQGVQSPSIGDCEGEMVQADVGASVEGDRTVRRLDLP